MNITRLDSRAVDRLAPLAAEFRATLLSYKGIRARADLNAGKEELLEFLEAGFPVFAAEEAGEYVGYLVCRIEEPCLWVEQLFVAPKNRRKGIASMLFGRAEALAREMGEETVFNYVHPNNEGIIQFLRSKGYTVLNMIEIRKPYKGETLTTTIRVGDKVFDY